MADQATVGQRFIQLISHLGISKNAFASSLDKTATVVQHLVEERNKPGFDLLCKVFEVYPNVSKDWLLQGVGPMLVTETAAPIAPPMAASEHANSAETFGAAESTTAPASAEQLAEPVVVPAVATVPPPAAAPTIEAPAVAPATPVPAASAAASMPPAPVTSPAPTPSIVPDAAWQTALYTQQMAHQLALAELRNQHLQEQQRLMQQMLDLMQRKM